MTASRHWVMLGLGTLVGAVLASAGLAWGASAEDSSSIGDDAPGGPTASTTTGDFNERPDSLLAGSPLSLGSALLHPGELTVDGTEAVFTFELTTAAPHTLGAEVDLSTWPPNRPRPNTDVNLVAPLDWTLIARDGREFEGATSSVRATTARFTVPEAFDKSDVAAIRLDRYTQRFPMEYEVEVDTSQPGERIHLDELSWIAFHSALEQESGVTYRFSIESSTNTRTATGLGDGLGFWGVGEGWVSLGGFAEGIQLTHASTELMDTVDIRIVELRWLPIDRPLEVYRG